MALTCTLLDYINLRMDCEFLSDLRYSAFDRRRLGQILREAMERQFSESEWKEACFYITREQAASQESAQCALLDFCAASGHVGRHGIEP